jgi:hypothetical protein
MTGVGVTKYRAWALQNIGRGRYKISGVGVTIHPAKGLYAKAAASAAPFLWPLGRQFIADTQYFGHAMCVFMRRAKQKAWRGG